MSLDIGSILGVFSLTILLYVGLPLLICTIIKAVFGKRPYKTVLVLNALAALVLIFYLREITGDTRPHNAAPAFIWSTIAYFLIIKIHGKSQENKSNTNSPSNDVVKAESVKTPLPEAALGTDFIPLPLQYQQQISGDRDPNRETAIGEEIGSPSSIINTKKRNEPTTPRAISKKLSTFFMALSFILSSLLIVSILSNYSAKNDFDRRLAQSEDTIASLQNDLEIATSDISNLHNLLQAEKKNVIAKDLTISRLNNLVDFYFLTVGIVTNRDKYYHRKGCQLLSSSAQPEIKRAYIYPPDTAKKEGYTPCPICQNEAWSTEAKR